MADRTVGMDHPHYRYSAMPTRPVLRWPGGQPVAVSVVVLLEHIEPTQPEGYSNIPVVDPFWRMTPPGVVYRFSAARDFGARVGIFRILDALERYGIAPTVAIDAISAEKLPSLVEHLHGRGAELVAHGISLSRPLSSLLSPERERADIAEALDRLEAATGTRPTGWYSPEQSESTRTPQILDELGVSYVCDWPNDDQPYVMTTPNGLVSLPTNFPTDDAYALAFRYQPLDTYVDNVCSLFANLAEEGRSSARSMVLVVRPWMMGKAYRIGAFERILETVTSSGDAWGTTTDRIVAAYRDQAG